MKNFDMKALVDRFRAARAGAPTHFNAKPAVAADSADLFIYDAIGTSFFGGISAQTVVDSLNEIRKAGAKALNIYINSPGGDVFDGVAMYNAIKRFDGKKTVIVDGLAASIASIVAMAGDEIRINANAMMMIHDPWSLAIGNSADMRRTADELDKIRDVLVGTYADRTGEDAETIKASMSAETWLTAAEALERGFCDVMVANASKDADEKATTAEDAAHPLVARFTNTPSDVRTSARASATTLIKSMQRRIENVRTTK